MSTADFSLTDSGYERGAAHGMACRQEITEALGRWGGHLAGRIEVNELGRRLCSETELVETATLITPELVDELRGIADGASVLFETIFAYGAIEESWWFLDEIEGTSVPAEHCSAITTNSGTAGIVAQTQDLPRHHDGGQVLFHYVEPDGLEILAPSLVGMIGLNGVNSAGLAVGVTTISALARSKKGLVASLAVARLLRCHTIDEALETLNNLPLASGNAYVLGTSARSVIVEASAGKLAVASDGPTAMQTNHPLRLTPRWRYPRPESSVERLEQLHATVGPDPSVPHVIDVLSTPPVCQSRETKSGFMTVATTVFELGGDGLVRCHMASGPGDSAAFVCHELGR